MCISKTTSRESLLKQMKAFAGGGYENMLAKLELKLDQKEEISGRMASSFHGVLMEQLPEAYAEEMHVSKRHPYTQHLEKRDGQWYWVITALNEKTAKKMLQESLMGLSEFTLKKHQLTVHVLEKHYEELSDQELAYSFYQDQSNRYFTIQFITPTAFKQNGQIGRAHV